MHELQFRLRVEGEERKGKGRELRREGIGKDPKGWFTPPISEILKNIDCRTDLISGGGNTDVCPVRQTPSCRHCIYQPCHCILAHEQWDRPIFCGHGPLGPHCFLLEHFRSSVCLSNLFVLPAVEFE